MRFQPAPDWNGNATLTFRAWDRTTGTACGLADATSNGAATAFSTATAVGVLTVQPINDAPVRTAGAVLPLTVTENSAPVSLGLASLAYGAGGAAGTDETPSQLLTFTVTAVPPASLGQVLLADGTTPVNAGSNYSVVELRGMSSAPPPASLPAAPRWPGASATMAARPGAGWTRWSNPWPSTSSTRRRC